MYFSQLTGAHDALALLPQLQSLPGIAIKTLYASARFAVRVRRGAGLV